MQVANRSRASSNLRNFASSPFAFSSARYSARTSRMVGWTAHEK